ncbi:MAG: hypothetical protein DRO12_05480 [Thermoprotei archaeon]|nr:MAG: hypothetical protein DRO12_05480 [Thermoprotei archaeon]
MKFAVYLVTFSESKVMDLANKLSKFSKNIKVVRSSVIPEFWRILLECEDCRTDDLKTFVEETLPDTWFKIETEE